MCRYNLGKCRYKEGHGGYECKEILLLTAAVFLAVDFCCI